MANTISLTNTTLSTSTAVKLLNGEITYSWKNMVQANPSNSSFGSVEAVFTGWENPALNLTFHIPIDNNPSGFMTWGLWNEFVKYQYDGVNQTTLAISVGASDTSFSDYSDGTSGDSTIPVIVKGYTLKFGANDSRNANFWTINAQLQVTK